MSTKDDFPVEVQTRRIAIFNRLASKFRALGTPIDTDPEFLGLVASWIDGRVEMADVIQGYSKIRGAAAKLKAKRALSSVHSPLPEQQSKEELVADNAANTEI